MGGAPSLVLLLWSLMVSPRGTASLRHCLMALLPMSAMHTIHAQLYFVTGQVTIWMGKCIGDVLNVKCERHQQVLRAHLLERGMSRSSLKSLDINHDGTVSRFEYLKFQLIAGEYPIDEADINRIMEQFDTLDTNGDNNLDIDDIPTIPGSVQASPRIATGGYELVAAARV